MTIDPWTLGFQTVNVAILIWLLQHFFWKPVAAIITERRDAAVKALAEAKATQDKATAALGDAARTRAGFREEHDAILAAARSEADTARTATLDDAKRQASALNLDAQASIEKDRVAAEAAWSDRASQLAVDIAGRLAGRLKGPVLDKIFFDWLLSGIRSLPDAVRQAASVDGVALDAVSATALPPVEQDRYRSMISDALGAHPQITVKEDPALIAGIEPHGPYFTVKNSWRADLGAIHKDLGHAAEQ